MQLNRVRPLRRGACRGVSIIELMIGLALGLFVVGGGLLLLAGFTDENRRLLLETRLVQDLRGASDIITRDLRRAGYWNTAATGVWYSGGPASPPQNPYSGMAGATCASAAAFVSTTTGETSSLCYQIDDPVSTDRRYGFELSGGVLYTVVASGSPRAITDPKAITVTDLAITPSSQVLDASSFCGKTCVGASCPQVVVREFEVLLKGHVPGDSGISRFLRSNVRIRNDHFSGQCPA